MKIDMFGMFIFEIDWKAVASLAVCFTAHAIVVLFA